LSSMEERGFVVKAVSFANSCLIAGTSRLIIFLRFLNSK
jgi:hypothetical protein